MRHLRSVMALGAFFLSMAVFAACGGVPGNSVATVGDGQITRVTFDHWLGIAARGNAPQTGATNVTVPDPPDFTKCVAALRKTSAKPAKGQPKVSDKQLKAQCTTQYDQYRDQTMNFLIQAQWVEGEAADRGIKVSESEVQKALAKQKKQAFRTDAEFRKFLKASGMTQDDILFRVKIDTLANKLRDMANKQVKKVTQADVHRYYVSHSDRFATPEQRTLRIVLTRGRVQAEQALRALRAGRSWKTVARKYSVDGRTKNVGGLLPNVAKGTEDAQLETAAFAAPKGKLVGPVKAPFGFYVLTVEKVTPRKQAPLAKTAVSIRQQLIAQRQQSALQTFIKDFRQKWTGKTDCREGFKVEGCKGVKAKKTATPTPTPTPQQQQPTPQQTPGG